MDYTQQSTSEWAAARTSAGIEPAIKVAVHKDAKAALEWGKGHLLIVDGPAHASDATIALGKAATLVVVPTGCSSEDLVPSVKVLNSLRKEGVPDERVLVVLTRVMSDAQEEKARKWLEPGRYRVAPGHIPDLVSFQNVAYGTALSEIVGRPALKQAIHNVLDAILDAIPEE
jgi:chromosome partitioning protein